MAGSCNAPDCYGKTNWPCQEDACRGADWLQAKSVAGPPVKKKRRWWKK